MVTLEQKHIIAFLVFIAFAILSGIVIYLPEEIRDFVYGPVYIIWFFLPIAVWIYAIKVLRQGKNWIFPVVTLIVSLIPILLITSLLLWGVMGT